MFPRDSMFNLIGQNETDLSDGLDDKRSNTETTDRFFNLRLSGGAVSWRKKKQSTVAVSLWEVDYQRVAAAMREATFLPF